MLAIAALDVRRIFQSKTTWVLLALAVIVMATQTVKEAYAFSFSVNTFAIYPDGFVPFLASLPTPASSTPDVLAWQASPTIRLMTSFWYLDYLALAVVVIFGGFFAQDVHSGYDLLRRCRGLSPRQLFGANFLTIVIVSFIFSLSGIALLYVVCLVVNPQGVCSLIDGQMILDQVFFLPQIAAPHPVLYIAMFVALYTGVLTFLGMLGHLAARVTGNVLVASIAPAGLVYVFGRFAAAHLPWPFWAFDYENLSFAARGITDPSVALRYVGGFFVWIAIFLVVGLLNPGTTLVQKGIRAWPSR